MNQPHTPQMPTEDALLHARERAKLHAADLTGAPEEFVLCHAIVVSQLFDAAYYLAENPDVADMDMDPIIHYVRHGAEEGRKPAVWFDSKACCKGGQGSSVNPFYQFLWTRHCEKK